MLFFMMEMALLGGTSCVKISEVKGIIMFFGLVIYGCNSHVPVINTTGSHLNDSEMPTYYVPSPATHVSRMPLILGSGTHFSGHSFSSFECFMY